MSTNNTDNNQFKELLENLVKIGVGGKFKDREDYVKLIQKELEFEERMIRGGIDRYNKSINDAKAKGQESTTKYGLTYTQKYVLALAEMLNNDVTTCMAGSAGVTQTSLKLICQCLSIRSFNEEGIFQSKKDNWLVVSYISLKHVLDGISKAVTVNELAMAISNALMQEARLTKFKDTQPEKYE